jgi:hypothetical protein
MLSKNYVDGRNMPPYPVPLKVTQLTITACWSREATKLLIDLYEENEDKMEDPKRKKNTCMETYNARAKQRWL